MRQMGGGGGGRGGGTVGFIKMSWAELENRTKTDTTLSALTDRVIYSLVNYSHYDHFISCFPVGYREIGENIFRSYTGTTS